MNGHLQVPKILTYWLFVSLLPNKYTLKQKWCTCTQIHFDHLHISYAGTYLLTVARILAVSAQHGRLWRVYPRWCRFSIRQDSTAEIFTIRQLERYLLCIRFNEYCAIVITLVQLKSWIKIQLISAINMWSMDVCDPSGGEHPSWMNTEKASLGAMYKKFVLVLKYCIMQNDFWYSTQLVPQRNATWKQIGSDVGAYLTEVSHNETRNSVAHYC